MASGITPNSECLPTFQDLKLKRKYKYIIFGINDSNTEVVVLKTSDSSDYAEFIDELPENECKWAVYDFEYEKEDGGKRNKLTFISWSPATAKIKPKMLYASSKDALRKLLVGVAIEIQATDYDEITYETVLEKVSRGN